METDADSSHNQTKVAMEIHHGPAAAVMMISEEGKGIHGLLISSIHNVGLSLSLHMMMVNQSRVAVCGVGYSVVVTAALLMMMAVVEADGFEYSRGRDSQQQQPPPRDDTERPYGEPAREGENRDRAERRPPPFFPPFPAPQDRDQRGEQYEADSSDSQYGDRVRFSIDRGGGIEPVDERQHGRRPPPIFPQPHGRDGGRDRGVGRDRERDVRGRFDQPTSDSVPAPVFPGIDCERDREHDRERERPPPRRGEEDRRRCRPPSPFP